MSIDVPQLDELTYEELVSRARRLISTHSDEWTDLNPHDPGVTILELLAWLTDTHSYELDRVTDDHRRKYLSLLGVTPNPPQPASVRLQLSPGRRQTGQLPAGTRLTATDGSGTDRQFETDFGLSLTDAELSAVVLDHEWGYEQHTDANSTEGICYRAFGDEPTAGSALALGFESDPFEAAETLSLFVDYHDADLPEPPDGAGPDSLDPSVELVWEFCRQYPDGDHEPQWESLTVERDTTNSLYESGFVRLERPATWEPTAWGSQEAGLFDHEPGPIWLRCRLETAGYEIPPQFNGIKLNVVAASHRRHHEAVLEPTEEHSPELAARTYQFDHAPVLSATVRVDGESWTEVEDFDASGPGDRHYVLDREQGTLTFGDAERGLRPPADATVTVEYVSGGGTDGNVPETASWRFSDGDQPLGDGTLSEIDISPRSAASGGQDAESVEAATARLKRELQTPARTVTEADHAAVAEGTPGLRIARTTVCLPAGESAAVSVVVVPYAPPDVSRPTPSGGFLEAVQDHLDSHRLLTDRVTAVSPTYVGLDITASVTVTDRYETGGGPTAIRSRLEGYLDPIRGFEGDGWPFGRALSTDELREQLIELPAVDHVEEVSIRTVGDAAVGPEGTVRIDKSALFTVEDVQVDATVRDTGSIGCN